MNITLMAHDKKKELMVQFCTAYKSILSKHSLSATAATGRLVAEATNLPVALFLSKNQGGHQQVDARIAYNEIDLVIMFSDPNDTDPWEDQRIMRTLRLCDGLDGHIVSGHVEGLGVIAGRRPEGIAMVVTINTPPELLKYIIKKGSIAIDGISLTVTQVTESSFSVSLIPHTAKETTLGFKDVGDSVNLETDIIGKYVEQMLKFNPKQTQEPALNKNMLLENGFI